MASAWLNCTITLLNSDAQLLHAEGKWPQFICNQCDMMSTVLQKVHCGVAQCFVLCEIVLSYQPCHTLDVALCRVKELGPGDGKSAEANSGAAALSPQKSDLALLRNANVSLCENIKCWIFHCHTVSMFKDFLVGKCSRQTFLAITMVLCCFFWLSWKAAVILFKLTG